MASVNAASSKGGAVGLTNDTITYTPPAGVTGGDSFTYTITDSLGGSATGMVSVLITQPGVNPNAVPIVMMPGGDAMVHFAGTPSQVYTYCRHPMTLSRGPI